MSRNNLAFGMIVSISPTDSFFLGTDGQTVHEPTANLLSGRLSEDQYYLQQRKYISRLTHG